MADSEIRNKSQTKNIASDGNRDEAVGRNAGHRGNVYRVPCTVYGLLPSCARSITRGPVSHQLPATGRVDLSDDRAPYTLLTRRTFTIV
ncbi:unnamed protein product [Danaus chrysippus]|uniref:(African queen) hypothetical protein n=1 Tax=Danaus chrysippus TaxID=151541 RepID=A0A8J2WDX8_9NEOP|nr:unnamed protein product [Danaus chrysippus]